MLVLEGRTLLSSSTLLPISSGAVPQVFPLSVEVGGLVGGTLETSGGLQLGSPLLFRVAPSVAGRLTIRATSSGSPIAVSLLDDSSRALAQADSAGSGGAATIDIHVGPGIFRIELEGGPAPYQISASLTPSTAPGVSLPDDQIGTHAPIAVGDVNGDGVPDVITPSGVLLGLGDGSFQPVAQAESFASKDDDPSSLILADIRGDGRPDLVVADSATNRIAVFRNLGGGLFGPAAYDPVGLDPVSIVAGHFGGAGGLDLAVADAGSNAVSVLKSDDLGRISASVEIPVGESPQSIAVADFNGDGHDDLAVACQGTDTDDGQVSLLYGSGGGGFLVASLSVGEHPTSVAVADLNHDGHPDLAVSLQGNTKDLGNFQDFNGIGVLQKFAELALNASKDGSAASGGLAVLLNRGDGTFRAPIVTSAGLLPSEVLVGDYNHDGLPDVAVLHGLSTEITVYLNDGKGSGTFAPPVQVNSIPSSIEGSGGIFHASAAVGDLNGDGVADLVGTNALVGGATVLLGRGDGSFEGSDNTATGDGPFSVAVGDLTNNGRADVVIANALSNTVSVLLGRGDGTFDPPLQFATGILPSTVVIADFNGDGRPDLAVANAGSGTVSILLGNGDGTFRPQTTYSVGADPTSIAVGDFAGDGVLDLAVVDALSPGLSILLGDGHGNFRPGVTYRASGLVNRIPVILPISVVAGDFSGDGKVDLAVADFSGKVIILDNSGGGRFAVGQSIAVPATYEPVSVVAGDLNGDGRTDLVVAGAVMENQTGALFSLLGLGDGQFSSPIRIGLPAGSDPISLALADFNGDGRLDVAVGEAGTLAVDVLAGAGDGTFQLLNSQGAGSFPISIATGDFDGNGRPGLAFARLGFNDLSVLINVTGSLVALPAYATATMSIPLLADLDGDGVPDTIVVDAKGHILWRKGRSEGGFDPPITINAGTADDASRAIAVVDIPGGLAVASVDAERDMITVFAYENGEFRVIGEYPTGPSPAQVVAVGLTSGQPTDLLVRNAGDGSITTLLATGLGQFAPQPAITVGLGLSDIIGLKQAGTDQMALAVVNQLSGTVELLQQSGPGRFTPGDPFLAGTGLAQATGDGQVVGQDATSGVASGPLFAAAGDDLVTISPNTDTFSVFGSLGDGRYSDPIVIQTPDSPRMVLVADLRHIGLDDVITLGADGVRVYLNQGGGRFVPLPVVAAEVDPTGFSLVDPGHGLPLDLLVGDPYGDVLRLVGSGDGSFRPQATSGVGIGLAVLDPKSGIVVAADPSNNQLLLQAVGAPTTLLGNANSGLIAPGVPVLSALGGDGVTDLIYANGGANEIEIRPYFGGQSFGPTRVFLVGTNPSGVAVHYFNGRPDLVAVADTGSNDVQIFDIVGSGEGWTLQAGPRLAAGDGPTSLQFIDPPGGGYPDLLVTDRLSNQVRLIPGVGSGFFNDAASRVFDVGNDPGPLLVGDFGAAGRMGAVSIGEGSGDLTLIPDLFGGGQALSPISSGGLDPTSAIEVDPGDGMPADLLVANGDGRLVLFLGGTSGLEPSDSMELQGVDGLAFDSLSGNVLHFFAEEEGSLAAAAFIFDLAGPNQPGPAENDHEGSSATAGPGSKPVGNSESSPTSEGGPSGGLGNVGPSVPAAPVARFEPSGDSPLTVVASLLTLSLETTSAEIGAGGSFAEASVQAGSSLDESLAGPPNQSDDSEGKFETNPVSDAIDGEDSVAGRSSIDPGDLKSLARYIFGLKEALQEARQESAMFLQGERHLPRTEKNEHMKSFNFIKTADPNQILPFSTRDRNPAGSDFPMTLPPIVDPVEPTTIEEEADDVSEAPTVHETVEVPVVLGAMICLAVNLSSRSSPHPRHELPRPAKDGLDGSDRPIAATATE